MKDRLLRTWANCRGRRTHRRLVVFESDDWGAAKIRDQRALDAMVNGGIDLARTPYDGLDCLEDRGDLQALFETLSESRDFLGRPAVFTFNAILANPDFDLIRADSFDRYSYEHLSQSYQRYHGEDLLPFWRQAMRSDLIRPQFHGREHLNVGLWLHDLGAGHADTRLAFEHEFYAHTTKTSSSRQKNYLAAFWPESESQFKEVKDIVVDGLGIFERLFGYKSRSFIACNYVMPEELEGIVAEQGVELIQGQRGQIQPSTDGSEVSFRRSYTGQRSSTGQLYSVRNVKFEPFEDATRDWVASALQEIGGAFFWGTPAIISTHRVNYVGGIRIENRDHNLRLLGILLKKIVETWPDVEFVSSDELIPIMGS